MKIDKFGIVHRTADELCSILYKKPTANLHYVKIDDPEEFNNSVKELYYDYRPLEKYSLTPGSVKDFDVYNQNDWFMPDSYKNMDIAKWILTQCSTEEELQRVGVELLMFDERGLINMLKFMKYFVDTMRANKVVWGVGRGSSVASYVLFLIGVHKIDSIYYDLPIEEFLK